MPAVISIDMINVKYEHFMKYLSYIEDCKKYFASKGATCHGWFMTEAGGQDEIVTINEWPSIDARSKAMDEIDKEGMELHVKVAGCIQSHCNILALPNPAVQCDKGHEIKKRIGFRAYKVCGDPMAQAKKYADTVAACKAKTGSDMSLHGILMPIAHTGPFNMIAVFEEGSKGIDDDLEKMLAFQAAPENAETMKEIQTNFFTVSARICKPIEAAKIAECLKVAGECGLKP